MCAGNWIYQHIIVPFMCEFITQIEIDLLKSLTKCTHRRVLFKTIGIFILFLSFHLHIYCGPGVEVASFGNQLIARQFSFSAI